MEEALDAFMEQFGGPSPARCKQAPRCHGIRGFRGWNLKETITNLCLGELLGYCDSPAARSASEIENSPWR